MTFFFGFNYGYYTRFGVENEDFCKFTGSLDIRYVKVTG